MALCAFTFNNYMDSLAGGAPIFSGDFNADGKLDLAMSGVIALGNGDGTFQTPGIAVPNILETVGDFTGDGRLDLVVSDHSANISLLLQTVTGVAQISPATLASSAPQLIGTTSPPQVITLTNAGNAALAIATIGIAGTNASDFAQTNTCGSTLAINANCNISVTFTPTAQGTRSAEVQFTDNAPGSPQGVSLTGAAATPALSPSPAFLIFAPQTPGTSSSAQTVTLTNSGTATLIFSGFAISGANAAGFSQTNNCASTLAQNASCQIMVISTPNAAGTQTASLNIADNAPGSPQAIALNGTGADFSLSASSQTSITVTPGQAANYSVLASGTTGFTQNVTLSCSGQPAQSTCTVTPSSVAPGSTATVAVVTTAASAGMMQPTGGPSANHPFGLWTVFSGTLGLALLLG